MITTGFCRGIALSIPLQDLEAPFYEGSVQKLYAVPNEPSLMVMQTTERGSVFDVGALFEIPGHDVNRAVFRHVLYSKMGKADFWKEVRESIQTAADLDEDYRREILIGPLEEFAKNGAKTHHVGMPDAKTGVVAESGVPENPGPYNVVRKFTIRKPERVDVLGASLFDYSAFPTDDGYVVPLEFIVRFGITSASSVYKKYLKMGEAARKAFEQDLGVKKPLEAWQYLDRPVSDYTTKFEPTDRMLSRQEAFITSCLPGTMFSDATKMTVLGAWAVRHLLAATGLALWDIKWEFAKAGDELVYVDTIDTDSFRATLELEFEGRKFVNHYNKQAMRDYFHLLHSDWIAAINETKARGDAEGVAFTELLSAGQEEGRYPGTPEVLPEFIQIQQRKLSVIRDYIIDKISGEDAAEALKSAGLEEISFYSNAGKLDDLAAINGV